MLYSSGRRTGLMVDVNADACNCVCVSEGFLLSKATISVDFPAGSDRVTHLDKLAEAILSSLRNVPLDNVAEMLNNVYIAGMGLLQTDLVKPNDAKSRELVATELLQRIEEGLCKGTRFQGRFSMDGLKVKVILPPEYKYSSWIGGSVLSGLSAVHYFWFRLDSDSHDEKRAYWERHLVGRGDGINAYWRIMKGNFDDSDTASFPLDQLNTGGLEPAKRQEELEAELKFVEEQMAAKSDIPKPKAPFLKEPGKGGPYWLSHWGKPELDGQTDEQKEAARKEQEDRLAKEAAGDTKEQVSRMRAIVLARFSYLTCELPCLASLYRPLRRVLHPRPHSRQSRAETRCKVVVNRRVRWECSRRRKQRNLRHRPLNGFRRRLLKLPMQQR